MNSGVPRGTPSATKPRWAESKARLPYVRHANLLCIVSRFCQRQKQNQKITATLEQFQDFGRFFFGRLDALFRDPIKTFDLPTTNMP